MSNVTDAIETGVEVLTELRVAKAQLQKVGDTAEIPDVHLRIFGKRILLHVVAEVVAE